MQVEFWRFMIATYCSTGFSSSDSCVSISGGSEWEWYVFYVPSPKLERNQTAGTLGSNLRPLGCTHLASFCSLFFGPKLGQTLLGWTTHAQFRMHFWVCEDLWRAFLRFQAKAMSSPCRAEACWDSQGSFQSKTGEEYLSSSFEMNKSE